MSDKYVGDRSRQRDSSRGNKRSHHRERDDENDCGGRHRDHDRSGDRSSGDTRGRHRVSREAIAERSREMRQVVPSGLLSSALYRLGIPSVGIPDDPEAPASAPGDPEVPALVPETLASAQDPDAALALGVPAWIPTDQIDNLNTRTIQYGITRD